jgi:hypothetical protein
MKMINPTNENIQKINKNLNLFVVWTVTKKQNKKKKITNIKILNIV